MTMVKQDAPVALIDLDGTVADYDGAMRREMELIRDPHHEPPYVGRNEFGEEPLWHERRRKLIQRQPGFWRNLDRLPIGFDVVEMMRKIGFTLHVLTKGPDKTPSAWSEKKEWCDANLSGVAVTVGMDKSLMYGRVLFDDWPNYFVPWLTHRPRGLVVCLAHPWNRDYGYGGAKHHPRVIRYDGVDRAPIERALRLAYDGRINANAGLGAEAGAGE